MSELAEPKTKPKPRAAMRIALRHPKMKGRANVLEKDKQRWLDAGWVQVKSGETAD